MTENQAPFEGLKESTQYQQDKSSAEVSHNAQGSVLREHVEVLPLQAVNESKQAASNVGEACLAPSKQELYNLEALNQGSGKENVNRQTRKLRSNANKVPVELSVKGSGNKAENGVPRSQSGTKAAAQKEQTQNQSEEQHTEPSSRRRRNRNRKNPEATENQEETQPNRSRRNQRQKTEEKSEANEEKKEVKNQRGKSKGKNSKSLADKKKTYASQYTPYTCTRKFESKYQEYQFGEWRRKKSSVFVTADTVIPAMPNKVLAEPDDVEFHMSQVKLDEQIEECNDKLTELNKDFELTLTKLKDDPKGGRLARKGLSAELASQFKEQAIYQGKKNEIRKTMEAFEKQIAAIGRTILTKQKQVHPVYNRVNLLDQGVRDLERRMTTQTLDRQTERQLIAEIEKVRKSRAPLEEIENLREEINVCRKKKAEAAEGFPELNQILKCIREEIDRLKEQETDMQSGTQDLNDHLNEINEQRTKSRDLIKKCRTQKADLKEIHYGKLLDYEVQQVLIHDIEWLTETKQNVMERDEKRAKDKADYEKRKEKRDQIAAERKKYDEERKAREQAKKDAIAAKKQEEQEQKLRKLEARHPYQNEIDECKQLLAFINANKVSEEDNSQAEPETNSRETEFQEKLQKEGLISGKNKQELEEEGMVFQGKKQNKSSKKSKKASAVNENGSMTPNYHTIMKFGRIGVSPPAEQSELDTTAEQVSEIKSGLETLGRMEQIEGKAKVLNNNKLLKSEEYVALQEKNKNQNEETLKRLQQIKEEKQKSWTNFDEDSDEDGDQEFGASSGQRRQQENHQNRGKRDREFEQDRSQRGGRGGRNSRGQQPKRGDVKFNTMHDKPEHFPTI